MGSIKVSAAVGLKERGGTVVLLERLFRPVKVGEFVLDKVPAPFMGRGISCTAVAGLLD